MTTFTCPLSAERLAHPCPVHGCPANLAGFSPEHSCAHELDDLGYATLAEVTGLDLAQLKSLSQSQATALAHLMRDLQATHAHEPAGACSGCGYVVPCTSASLCAERAEAMTEILVKIGGAGGVSLKPGHLWFAALHNHASFLTTAQRARLRELSSARHLKDLK